MPTEKISSPNNPTLKLARRLLKSPRERWRAGKILLDGSHLIESYVKASGADGMTILISNSTFVSEEMRGLVASLSNEVRVLEVPDAIFGDFSPVETPTGIVAIAQRPVTKFAGRDPQFCLALDGIQDPGNLGSILRTAAATGVDRVLLSNTCADQWSPKCLRGGMGAQFVLPVSEHVNLAEALAQFSGPRIATSSHAGTPLSDIALSAPAVVMIGGEGQGLSGQLLEGAELTIRIPMSNSIESLNVGAAVAMICYERLRQAAT